MSMMTSCCCCRNHAIDGDYVLAPEAPEEFNRLELTRVEQRYDDMGKCCMKTGAYMRRGCARPFLPCLGGIVCQQGLLWSGLALAPMLHIPWSATPFIGIGSAGIGCCAGATGCCLVGKCLIASGTHCRNTAEQRYYERMGQIVGVRLTRHAQIEEAIIETTGQQLRINDIINLIITYEDDFQSEQHVVDWRPFERSVRFPVDAMRRELIAFSNENEIVDQFFDL